MNNKLSLLLFSLFATQALGQEKIDLYKCSYITHPIIIKAENVAIKPRTAKGKICLASVECNLQALDAGLGYPPVYESWVACLPDKKGFCPLDAEVCKKDERIEFVDAEQGKIKVHKALREQKAIEEGVAE